MDKDSYSLNLVKNKLTFKIDVKPEYQFEFLNKLFYYSYKGVNFCLEKQKATFNCTIFSNNDNISLTKIKSDIENILEKIKNEKNNRKFW
jgi:hypothetical protein